MTRPCPEVASKLMSARRPRQSSRLVAGGLREAAPRQRQRPLLKPESLLESEKLPAWGAAAWMEAVDATRRQLVPDNAHSDSRSAAPSAWSSEVRRSQVPLTVSAGASGPILRRACSVLMPLTAVFASSETTAGAKLLEVWIASSKTSSAALAR